MDHYINVKYKNYGTFRKKKKKENLWNPGPGRVLSLDPQNTIHKREN